MSVNAICTAAHGRTIFSKDAQMTSSESDVHEGMCIGAEISIRKKLMDLNAMLSVDGKEVLCVTIGGAPDFEVNIIHGER
jgi:hypothetical protein